jgi:hypothetical protein
VIYVTIHRLFIIFFLLYAMLILLFAQGFVAENSSVTLAMIGSCIIIALIFGTRRAVIINIIIAFYVFQNYLTLPFVSFLNNQLSFKDSLYIESLHSYYTVEAAAVVYWSLFSLLLAWLIGLLALRPLKSNTSYWYPKLFKQFDYIVLDGAMLPFLMTFGLIYILNYKDPASGLSGAVTGKGSCLFLWGLSSLHVINIVCLYAFLKRRYNKLKPAKYYLLIPVLCAVLYSVFSGQRSTAFFAIIYTIVYVLLLKFYKRWYLKSLIKIVLFILITLPVTIILALFAQALRPLYKYSESVDTTMILDTMNYEYVLLAKDKLFFGLSELLQRLTALKGQFYILNDWYIHEPLKYYNPVRTIMRITNNLVPGSVFPGMFTINQLFDFIYYGTTIHYSSQYWSIQGTLYLYFGHIFAPIAVFVLGILINYIYPLIERLFVKSPSFAAFFTLLLFDFLTNGTLDRIVPLDIIRPIIAFAIFLALYKVFSFFFQSIISAHKK